MRNWSALIPQAPFDWVLIPLDGRKRPINPDTGDLMEQWQQQPGYDVDGISALNGKVQAVGLMLGEKSGGVLQVDFDGPKSPAKFQEVFGRSPQDLPKTIGVTSGKESRGSRFFLIDEDWWHSLRGRKAWKDAGDICLELRWTGHQAVIAGAHPETKGYRWLDNSSPADLEMATAPEWLLEPLVRTESTYEPVELSAEDSDRAVAMLQFIDPNDRDDYNSWLEIGMALHHTDEGLLSEWVSWSSQMANFNEKECLDKWSSFASYKGKPLTIGALHHFAKQAGYKESKRPKPEAQPAGVAQGDPDLLGYSDLLDNILESIRTRKLDREMLCRAGLKSRFRVSDDRINTDLFKRLSDGKVQKIKPKHDSIVLADIEVLDYSLDGWNQRGEIGLLYGSYGCGKTTLAIWKAYNAAQGKNILDRSKPCYPIKSLIIATDSGLGPLKKSCEDLGIDLDNDPLFQPGHPDQMIWVWGHDPGQGHAAWICDIHGIIRLEEHIEKHGIGYVAIDSAKSVSSAAGWSYTSNESVKALLKYFKEVVAKPHNCFLEFLSHDGCEKGSHSGAKAWAEDPSMVARLELIKDEETGKESVCCQFRKDRAAVVDPRRKVGYFLEDCELKLSPNEEVVGNCDEAILDVLWTAHQRGVDRIRTKDLTDAVWASHRRTRKTVENSLPSLKSKRNQRIVSPRRGVYALSPAEIQRRSSSPNRDLYKKGGGISRATAPQWICQPPSHPPEGGTGGNQHPEGEASGGDLNPDTAKRLRIPPPGEGRESPNADHGEVAPMPPPTLTLPSDPNGNNEAIWDVIDNNPGLHPHQLANKIHAATGLRLDGRQVRYLIDNRLF